jgi:hypothetical protein
MGRELPRLRARGGAAPRKEGQGAERREEGRRWAQALSAFIAGLVAERSICRRGLERGRMEVVSVSEPQPVRGKQSGLDLGVYGKSCADDDANFVSDYLHTNGYLQGPRLQLALNRALRRGQLPAKVGRGGLSRREWKRLRSSRARRGE